MEERGVGTRGDSLFATVRPSSQGRRGFGLRKVIEDRVEDMVVERIKLMFVRRRQGVWAGDSPLKSE